MEGYRRGLDRCPGAVLTPYRPYGAWRIPKDAVMRSAPLTPNAALRLDFFRERVEVSRVTGPSTLNETIQCLAGIA